LQEHIEGSDAGHAAGEHVVGRPRYFYLLSDCLLICSPADPRVISLPSGGHLRENSLNLDKKILLLNLFCMSTLHGVLSVENVRSKFSQTFTAIDHDVKECQQWDEQINEARGQLKSKLNHMMRIRHHNPESPESAARKKQVVKRMAQEFTDPSGVLHAQFDALIQGQHAWKNVEQGSLHIDESSQDMQGWRLEGLHDDDDVMVVEFQAVDSLLEANNDSWATVNLRFTPLVMLYMGKSQKSDADNRSDLHLLASVNYGQISQIDIKVIPEKKELKQKAGFLRKALYTITPAQRVVEISLHSYVSTKSHILRVHRNNLEEQNLHKLIQFLACRATCADVKINIDWNRDAVAISMGGQTPRGALEGNLQRTDSAMAASVNAPEAMAEKCKTAMARRKTMLDLMRTLME